MGVNSLWNLLAVVKTQEFEKDEPDCSQNISISNLSIAIALSLSLSLHLYLYLHLSLRLYLYIYIIYIYILLAQKNCFLEHHILYSSTVKSWFLGNSIVMFVNTKL